MKLFFGYSKYYSLTGTSTLLERGLPSFDTLIFNSRLVYPINVRVLRMVLLRIYAEIFVLDIFH